VAGLFALALVAAVVETVAVAVCAVVPEMLTEAGTEQVGLLEAAAPPVRMQVSFTDPPNPLEGATVRVDVPDCPGVVMVMLPLVETAMPAFAGSATVMVVVSGPAPW
jgi:hypothetical protein